MLCLCQYMSNRENGSGWREILQSALHELTGLLQEEGLVSSYEIHSSGLVQALLSVVSTSPWDQASTPTKTNKLQKQRVAVFKNCFKVCIINKTKLFIFNIGCEELLAVFTAQARKKGNPAVRAYTESSCL